jgi:hypothetical protein
LQFLLSRLTDGIGSTVWIYDSCPDNMFLG